MKDLAHSLGVYLHVPYCKALCHYCDFAKTANFDRTLAATYLSQLVAHLAAWLSEPEITQLGLAGGGIASVFLGGGTPSLFTDEYAELFAMLRHGALPVRLKPAAEISLEANPDDITAASLATWRGLGINRLSLGVQTFAPAGLSKLRRVHSAQVALQAVTAAKECFPNLNIDLIYGWEGQDLAIWQNDLRTAVGLGINHLSLYTLTYEPRTPLGRAAARGLTLPQDDERLASFYDYACHYLAEHGYTHEEVSNWSRAGSSCQHNWLYWGDGSYLGVGAGAHGYLADHEALDLGSSSERREHLALVSAGGPGRRYAYARNDRSFARRRINTQAQTLGDRYGIEFEAGRTPIDWLTELVGSSLRTQRGVPLRRVVAKAAKVLRPTPLLREGFDRGLLHIDELGHLKLTPAEWFRETGWAVEVLRSLM